MFIYGPGAGFSGECKFVAPGDELKFNEKVKSEVDVTITQGFQCASSTQFTSDGLDEKFCQMPLRFIYFITFGYYCLYLLVDKF